MIRKPFWNAALALVLSISTAPLLPSLLDSAQAAGSQNYTTSSVYYPYGTLLRGKVAKVSDGDTIHFVIESEYGKILFPQKRWEEGTMPQPETSANAGTKLKVRMVGIDTAELHLPAPGGVYSQGYWGEEGERELARTIPVGSTVDLHTFGADSHGRVLGRVYFNQEDVNLHMVEAGIASTYTICQGPTCRPGYFEEQLTADYEASCERAMAAQRGIHSPVNGLDELPFEFRLRIQQRSPNKYVGDSRTKKLYLPEDYAKIPECNRVFFPLLTEAQKMGYKPIFKLTDEKKIKN